jgi:hypothetical protein
MADRKTRIVKLHSKYRPSLATGWFRNHVSKDAPWLNVSGKWLEKAGFRTGDQVAIEVSEGKLIITKAQGDGVTGN